METTEWIIGILIAQEARPREALIILLSLGRIFRHCTRSRQAPPPAEWTATGLVRVIAGDEPPSSSTVRVGDGISLWSMEWQTGIAEGFYYLGREQRVLLSLLDVSSEYRSYQMLFRDNGPGTADDTVGFYIDGVPVGSASRWEVPASGTVQMRFGDMGLGGASVNYAKVSLALGNTVIPEPSTSAIAVTCALMVGALILRSPPKN